MKLTNFALIAALIGLTACGGGGDVIVEPGTVDGTSGTVDGTIGTVETSRYMFYISRGSLREKQSSLSLETADYVYHYDNVGILDPYGEVLGAIAPDLPVDAIYTGTGVVDAIGVTDGTAVYDLTDGNAQVVLSENTVDVTLNGFTVYEHEGSTASPVGSITITNVDVGVAECGNAVFFCGGDFMIRRQDTSGVLINSSATQDLKGAFFGEDGAEVGGYILIDQDQTLNLKAAFIAGRQQ